jgi:hypothetical protein
VRQNNNANHSKKYHAIEKTKIFFGILCIKANCKEGNAGKIAIWGF